MITHIIFGLLFLAIFVCAFVVIMRKGPDIDMDRVPSSSPNLYTDKIVMSKESFLGSGILQNSFPPVKLAQIYTYNYGDFEKAVDVLKKYKFKTYEDVFIGNNIVSYINNNGIDQIKNYNDSGVDVVVDKRGDINKIEQAISETQKKVAVVEPPKWKEDSQNVHDPAVVQSVDQGIDKICGLKSAKDKIQWDMRELFEEHKNEPLILDILNYIKKYDQVFKDKLYESQILKCVWEKADKDMLSACLLDCVDQATPHFSLVCTSGRISRYLQALPEDHSVSIVDTNTLNNEIFQKVSVMVKEAPPSMSSAELKKKITEEIENSYKHLEKRTYTPGLEMCLNAVDDLR